MTAAFGVVTGLAPLGAVAVGAFAQAFGLRLGLWLITAGMAFAVPIEGFSAVRTLKELPKEPV